MVKKEGVTDISVGTEAWNVADGYTKIKILRNLILLDRWEIMAQYGTEEMDEDANLTQNQINKRRIEALNRFVSTLRQLVGNVKFAIKKDSRPKIIQEENRISLVKKYLSYVYEINENGITHDEEIEINEDLFNKCLNILIEVKDNLNFPINASGLIFRESAEIDLDKLTRDIIEGG